MHPTRSSVYLAALVAICLLASLSVRCLAAPAPSLQAGFENPPHAAKPQVWWHWCNGNITSQGITADLESMARVGIGGAEIFDVNPGIPAGTVKYNSPEWRALIKHAMTVASRLGLEMCIHNGAGWSSSGGPWITPAESMQMLVFTETRAKGPGRISVDLPHPQMRDNYYQDIAVLAYPTPPAAAERMIDAHPKITSTFANVDLARLTDGNPGTGVFLRLSAGNKPQYIQFAFAKPFTARGITIQSAGRTDARMELQSSNDGEHFTKICNVSARNPSAINPPTNFVFAPVTAKYFRLAFFRNGRGVGADLAGIDLNSGYRVNNWGAKAGYVRAGGLRADTPPVPADGVYHAADVVDLTSKMDAKGHLTWDAPAGNWTIMRFGHTTTGITNHPAPASGTGLECDKMSKAAVDAHFAGMLGKVCADLGPLVGTTFKNVLIDSYEVDTQNWTPLFRQDFKRLRGYDPLPYLPVMAGRVEGSAAASERFLWDVRRTIADLFAEDYYGHYAELCHEHGLKLSAEVYGNGGFNTLQSGGAVDLPMSEFWAGWGNDNTNAKLASSVGHTYGRPVVGAESYTAAPDQAGWRNWPYSLKALGDLIWCGGVNRFIFHTYAMQPWLTLKPGMTMGPFGTEFTRNVTWWKQGRVWMKYIARSQFLLQSGHFVGDLVYFYGENAPNDLPGRAGLRPSPPAGYDYDGCDEEIIDRMSVRDGRIVLPDGMSYRMLILPSARTMTPALARKIAELVRDGATVMGPKPTASPSLDGYPDCDRQVQTIADEVWGNCDGQKVTEHAYGKGRIIWGQPLADVLKRMKIAPDFTYTATGAKPLVNYIHRVADGADIYFIACHSPRSQVIDASFRVTGKKPELWDPNTGNIELAPVWQVKAGRTVIPLRFNPSGSIFVVFRATAGPADPIVAASEKGRSIYARRPGPNLPLVIEKAEYGAIGVPSNQDYADLTDKVRGLVNNNKLSVQATNAFAGGDPAPNVPKQMRVDYTIDGKAYSKTVDENQALTLPAKGQPAGKLVVKRALYGILPAPSAVPPTPPGIEDVTAAVRKMVVHNTLSVAATNTNFGDPAEFIVKKLRVQYTLNGKPYTRTVSENDIMTLPDGTEAGLAGTQMPSPVINAPSQGSPTVTAFEAGTYDATTASGKHLRARIAAVPAPAKVTGPWEVQFPPNWGAPPKATFDHLASWTENANDGIKYFSGTATYTKQIDITPAMLAQGKVLLLDLGDVGVMAEVHLNGKDLGILWKPPFRVDITSVAKPGANQLEVAVVNLWVNRLIGDDHCPPDAKYNANGSLAGWPSWLPNGQEGRPRPKTGRYCFTTWKHWSKNSPLRPSGLMGPVRLIFGQKATLK